MKKFLAGVAVAGLVVLAMAVAENPALVKLGGVLNEAILNYNAGTVIASRATVGYGALPTCPDTSVTSDTPVSALAWTSDAGWVQCTALGWLPRITKGTLGAMDGGTFRVQVPGTWLADGGFTSVGAQCACTLVTGTAPTACFIDGGLLNAVGGAGISNYLCE